MPVTHQLTAIIQREGDGYMALCPGLDIASQGTTVNEARDNLREALELFLEAAGPEETGRRLTNEFNEFYVTHLSVAVQDREG